MGTMRYKPSDKVRIKSLDWYRKYANKDGIIVCGNYYFTQDMLKYCGKVLMITNVIRDFYVCKDINYQFSDEMFEGLVEEKTGTALNPIEPKSNANRITQNEVDVIENAKTYWDSIKDAWICPEGYQFVDEHGNVINATKIVLEKKKKEYPKTFRECQAYLGEDVLPIEEPSSKTYRRRQVHLLEVLLTCRDAYWKIAGNWKPEYPFNTARYVITNSRGFVGKVLVYDAAKNYVLEFPTEEMRDAFYENFKKEIEDCKELL